MGWLFSLYLIAFWFVHARRKSLALTFFGMAVASSIGMFLYHADSPLNLNW